MNTPPRITLKRFRKMNKVLTVIKYVLYAIGFGLLIPISLTFFMLGGVLVFVFSLLALIAYIPLLLAESIDNEHWISNKVKAEIDKRVDAIKDIEDVKSS